MGSEIYCRICRKKFSKKGIDTHFLRMHGTKEQKEKYSVGCNNSYHKESYRNLIKERKKAYFDEKLGPLTDFKVSCHKCDTQFTVTEREKKVSN